VNLVSAHLPNDKLHFGREISATLPETRYGPTRAQERHQTLLKFQSDDEITSPQSAIEATTFTCYLLPVLYLRDLGIFASAWVGGWYINFPAFPECRMPVRKFTNTHKFWETLNFRISFRVNSNFFVHHISTAVSKTPVHSCFPH